MKPFASVVVVDMDGGPLLEDCLRSLCAQTERDFELLLVDNASRVPSESLVPAALRGRARVLRNEKNLGFAEAGNQAAAEAQGDWLLLLNNDALLEADFLAVLRREATLRPEYDLFAAKVLIRSLPGYLDSAGLGVFLDGVARCRGWQEPSDSKEEPAEVLGPAGSVAAVRREAFLELGGFDEDFFLYLEDLDFALRALWAGRRCLYLPALRARHERSSTTGKHTVGKAYFVERNHLWVALKNFPAPLALLSPLYTAYRYGLQAYAAATRQGITAGFVRDYGWRELAPTLLRAYRDALQGGGRMLRKRRALFRTRRIGTPSFLARIMRHRLSWRSFAFKD